MCVGGGEVLTAVAAYLACTAIINGARTKDQVLAVVKGGFPKIIKVCITLYTRLGILNNAVKDFLDDHSGQHAVRTVLFVSRGI